MFKIFLIFIFTFKFNPRRNVLLYSTHSHEFYATGMGNIFYRIYGRHIYIYIAVTPLLYYNLAGLTLGLVNIFCIHSVSSGLFYEGANFMINGLPEISIKYFSELAGIIILS